MIEAQVDSKFRISAVSVPETTSMEAKSQILQSSPILIDFSMGFVHNMCTSNPGSMEDQSASDLSQSRSKRSNFELARIRVVLAMDFFKIA